MGVERCLGWSGGKRRREAFTQALELVLSASRRLAACSCSAGLHSLLKPSSKRECLCIPAWCRIFQSPKHIYFNGLT